MSSPLNPATLTELQGILGDDLFDITDLFAQQVPAELDALAASVQAADWPQVARAAHALKGSCGNVGAVALSQWAGGVEVSARAGHSAAVQAVLDEAPPLLTQTLAAMRASGFLRG
ncbi:Hpt domain-containing protein [Macromonas nakdongensis]|uniref:Hpt domain-containing protein n=1 Tax=Macromonas nakdongensis TaxID=1843082 RepID=UPI0012FEA8C3|nr:Hpt domain-containing protein [Macromonas nakdongensis]